MIADGLPCSAAGDAQQLAAVQQLAVREMDVGEGDLADLHDLRAPARQRPGRDEAGSGRICGVAKLCRLQIASPWMRPGQGRRL